MMAYDDTGTGWDTGVFKKNWRAQATDAYNVFGQQQHTTGRR